MSIRTRLKSHFPAWQVAYGLEALWIAGSHARGEATPTSDLDLLALFGRDKPSLLRFASLVLEIEDATGLPVDLVERDAIRPEIEAGLTKDALLV